jgi:hypothetical protein
MPDTRQLVFDMFRSLGVSPQAALGAMYSLGGESGAGFNPKSYNPNDPGGSIGIGQWNQTRRAGLEALAGRMGLRADDPVAQVAFLKQELTGPYSGVLGMLKQTNDTNAAAHIWTKDYEAPRVDNSEQRIAGGHNVGSLDAQGNFVLGSPGGMVNTGSSAAPSQTTAALLSNAAEPLTLADYTGKAQTQPVLATPKVQSAGLSPSAVDAQSAQDKQSQAALMASMAQLPSARPAPQMAQAQIPLSPLGAQPGAPPGAPPGQLADLFKVADIGQAPQLKRPGAQRIIG